MCFGYVDELTRRLAINQTVRLSIRVYVLTVRVFIAGCQSNSPPAACVSSILDQSTGGLYDCNALSDAHAQNQGQQTYLSPAASGHQAHGSQG